MKTTINGKDASWPPEVKKLWEKVTADFKPDWRVGRANWFTARPYLHEYETGSSDEGFTYTLYTEKDWSLPQVWQATFEVGVPEAAYILPRTKES